MTDWLSSWSWVLVTTSVEGKSERSPKIGESASAVSMEAVEFATLEWVDWLNNRRLLEPIGNIPPADAEANYYAAQEPTAVAA